MPQTDRTVFISYRRTDIAWALHVYKDLTAHGFDVFFDFQNIDSGSFEQIILQNIASRAHFVVILTPSALERCANPGDWLRREIEYALEMRRNIVPLMLEGFDYSSPAINTHLTGRLAALREFNAQRIPADFFDEAMARVRNRFLNTTLEAVIYPPSLEAQRAAQAQQRAASAAPAVEESALSASEWFEKGVALGNNSDEEIRCYTEAIRLKPDYAEAYNNRGNAALRDYTEAIRLKPDYADAYYNRGNAYDDQGDLNAALRDYTEAIRLKPDYADAYNNRGGAYHNQGDLASATADYEAALRIDPNHVSARKNLEIARRQKAQGK